MSKAFSLPFPGQTPPLSFLKQSNNVASSSALPSSSYSGNVSSTSTGVWQPPAHWNLVQAGSVAAVKKKSNKIRKRTPEELDITVKTAARVSSRIAADHQAVLYPDTETPFANLEDAINRLLPYHVYELPAEDMDWTGKGKGKSKASELEEEIQETKFALECFRRRRALEERFRNARVKAGQRSAPSDQDYFLAQTVLDSERGETAAMNAELRAARAELDRLKDKDKKSSSAARTQPYYASAQPYYRYAYAQPYIPAVIATPTTTTAQAAQPAASSSQNPPPATTTATTYTPQLGTVAIPVQIPATSLPALHALGITPVPVSTDGSGQAACILKGSSADGSMLSLEINISLLQSTQMNGLATLLNTLLTKHPSVPSSSNSSSTNNSTAATPVTKDSE